MSEYREMTAEMARQRDELLAERNSLREQLSGHLHRRVRGLAGDLMEALNEVGLLTEAEGKLTSALTEFLLKSK